MRLQPDYILFTENHSESNDDQELSRLRTRPAWKALKAIQTGHIVKVDDEITKPSPGLVDAIEQLARELHPEAFSTSREIIPQLEERTGMEIVAAKSTETEWMFCAR